MRTPTRTLDRQVRREIDGLKDRVRDICDLLEALQEHNDEVVDRDCELDDLAYRVRQPSEPTDSNPVIRIWLRLSPSGSLKLKSASVNV